MFLARTGLIKASISTYNAAKAGSCGFKPAVAARPAIIIENSPLVIIVKATLVALLFLYPASQEAINPLIMLPITVIRTAVPDMTTTSEKFCNL